VRACVRACVCERVYMCLFVCVCVRKVVLIYLRAYMNDCICLANAINKNLNYFYKLHVY